MSAIEILMPQLSESMEEGTIARWLIAEGATFATGDELAEIETDKATVVYQAEISGELQIVVPEGHSAPVGSVIARARSLADVDESHEPMPSSADHSNPAQSSGVSDSADVASAEIPSPSPAPPPPIRHGSEGPLSTPIARRLAESYGIALTEVVGSGPRGRITRADVFMAARVSSSSRAPRDTVLSEPSISSRANPTHHDIERIELTATERTIGRRMAESTAVPDFQVMTEVGVDAVVALRSELRSASDSDQVPTLNDFVVKACALALRKHPRLNASFQDDHLDLSTRINIGIAVAARSSLVVPTIFDADTKSLGTIARESRELVLRVRNREVTPQELSGGTFTISNLGMYGMTSVTPIIYGSQAAIVGVGAIRTILMRSKGGVVDRQVLALTASCDHRVVNGAEAAEFLNVVKHVLEHPLHIALW